ncbi:MAG TPA: hypothetical protein VIY29_16315 [Ktedonobacteraceae bacterium]
MRLSTWMSYESARELLADLLGVRVSKATASRVTLATGEAQLSVCEQEEERLKQEAPSAPEGAQRQALSADGAFVHLVGGEWAEVKTLSIGEVSRTSRTFRGCVMPRVLRKRRSSKRIGEDWNEPARCVPCKRERSGCKDWWITTGRMQCASWTDAACL